MGGKKQHQRQNLWQQKYHKLSVCVQPTKFIGWITRGTFEHLHIVRVVPGAIFLKVKTSLHHSHAFQKTLGQMTQADRRILMMMFLHSPGNVSPTRDKLWYFCIPKKKK